MQEPGHITQLLTKVREGDKEAQDRLFEILYDELRELAREQRRRFREANQTLNTTALIHELYLKLDRAGEVVANDRRHFFLLVSRAMRQILINHARDRKRLKRGGDSRNVTLGPEGDRSALIDAQGNRLLDIDLALSKLAKMDERLGQVTELHFFGGLTYDEIADVLEIGRATVARDWKVARAWLRSELSDLRDGGGSVG